MGTSSSSSGPKGGVPFDPPWLDAISAEPTAAESQDTVQPDTDQEDSVGKPSSAPPRRFYNARRYLNDFARTGNDESLGRALGHYSRTGMGGSRNAAARMRVSTKSAGRLFSVLNSARDGSDPTINQWVRSLSERNPNAQDVIDEIIRQVAPPGGSLDETSCRESMAQAMQDLMEKYPDANLLHLSDSEIWMVVELFLGYEAFNRLCNDIGQIFESPSLGFREIVARVEEMKEFLKAEISVQTDVLRQATPNPTSVQLRNLLRKAVLNTFFVYEGGL